MSCLGDHERRPGAQDARGLAQDHLRLARVAVAGEPERLLGGLDPREVDDAALGLRDHLLRDTDDVAVLERDRGGDHRRQVVALADLGEPFDRNDRHCAASGATTSW